MPQLPLGILWALWLINNYRPQSFIKGSTFYYHLLALKCEVEMILSGIARKISRFVQRNSRLIDTGNNVAAHSPLRLRIHDQPISIFWAGRHVSDHIERRKIEFIMHHYFSLPSLARNRTRQKDNNATSMLLVLILRVPTKDSLLLQLFAPIWSCCWSVQCKNCSMDGERNKANEFSSCMGRMVRNPSYVHTDGRIFFKSTDR